MSGTIIYSCEHYWICSQPLYTGECMKECIERYKKYYGIKEMEQKAEQMKAGGMNG